MDMIISVCFNLWTYWRLYRLIYTFKTDNEATVYDRFTWKTHLGLTLKISLMKLSNILYLAKLCTTVTVKDLLKLFYLS